MLAVTYSTYRTGTLSLATLRRKLKCSLASLGNESEGTFGEFGKCRRRSQEGIVTTQILNDRSHSIR